MPRLPRFTHGGLYLVFLSFFSLGREALRSVNGASIL